jgi:hypothetical protein
MKKAEVAFALELEKAPDQAKIHEYVLELACEITLDKA